MIKTSYPEDIPEEAPILRFDSVVLFPRDVFPLRQRKRIYELSEEKTYWTFPPFGAWRVVLQTRIKRAKFIIVACAHVFDFGELMKYNLTGKHVILLCTSDLVNVDLPGAHCLRDFENWYRLNIDSDGANYCTEHTETSFQLLSQAYVTVLESDHPEYYGAIVEKTYHPGPVYSDSVNFRYCNTIRQLMKLERWPEPKTVIVMHRAPSELLEQSGKSWVEINVETCNLELGDYYRRSIWKKSHLYVNKKGHFSIHNAGRWYPEGEMLFFNGSRLVSLLTGEQISESPRIFFQPGNWIHVLALPLCLLRNNLFQMFDRIIFLTDRRHLPLLESDENMLRRCAKEVVIFRYNPK